MDHYITVSALWSLLILASSCKGSEFPPVVSISKLSSTMFEALMFESSDQNRTFPLVEGNAYQFQCSKVGFTGGSLQWRQGGTVVTTVTSAPVYVMGASGDTPTLIINSFLGSRDGGMLFSCVAGNVSSNFMLTSGNPIVIPNAERKGLEATISNTRHTLIMFVDGNPTPGGHKWLYNGNGIDSLSVIADTFQLILPRAISTSLTGNYTLQVNNSVGVATGTTYLLITVKPVLSLQPSREIFVRANQEIVILCVANNSVPLPTFSWRINGALVDSSTTDVIIRNMTVEGLLAQEIRVPSPKLSNSGSYSCVGDNSFLNVPSSTTVQAWVTVTGPLPPTDFGVSLSSSADCMVEVTWTHQVENTGNYSVVPSDNFSVEIRYLTNSGPVLQELLMSPSSGASGLVRFVEQNTMFMLRGRGISNAYGMSDYSDWFGPFIAYTSLVSLPPSVSSVVPLQPKSLNVSWVEPRGPSASCYYPGKFEVECVEEGTSSLIAVNISATSTLLTGLSENSYYSCRVRGFLFAVALDGSFLDLGLSSPYSENFMMYTLPRAPDSPAVPAKGPSAVVTDTSFVMNVVPLTTDMISHYQVIVLRLIDDKESSFPSQDPDDLYPYQSTFSNCVAVNSKASSSGPFSPYVAAEISASELERRFTVGSGKAEGIRGDTICNGPLLPGGVYTAFLRAYPVTLGQSQPQQGRRRRNAGEGDKQYVVFSSSSFLSPAVMTGSSGGPNPTMKLNTSNTAIVAIPVIVVILAVVVGTIIIVLVVVGLLYKKHQRSSYNPRSSSSSLSDGTMDSYNMLDLTKNHNGGTMIEMKERDEATANFADPLDVPFDPSGDVTIENFKDHVEKCDAKRQLLFQEEFEWITKNSPWHEATASQDERNDEKNRYSNITAFDHSRVKLQEKMGVECSDYINANYVTGYNRPREYIASQGPLERTVEDFWRMVWEQGSTTIIMLTNVVELGKIKCTQYWPNSSTTMYGDIAVTLENTHMFPDYVIRTLAVEKCHTGESRRILQFHYTKWPDYGTPKLAAPLLNFLRIVHESCGSVEEDATRPMVVHCSAGVGRSGTVLTIDYCLQQLRKEGKVNVCKFVQQMRNERNYMVQTDQQYTFIHYAILESITYGDTSFEVDKFMTSYRELQAGHAGPDVLQDEFERLGRVKTMVKKSSFQNRIRIKGAPQRHFHSSFHGGSTSGSGSIQQCLGHFLDSYNQSSLFLVTEGPDDRTTSRFWEMVWDNDCRLIIMMTPVDEDFFKYWPMEECQFGSIKVLVESESEEHLYTCRKIRLANTKVEGLTHDVVQYQFMGWTRSHLPRVLDFVSFFCSVLQARGSLPEKSKIMIHDTASLGPAGIFCSLFHCIQRVQIERVIDIFQAVQYVQLQRPGCVSTLRDYVFLYDCVNAYLEKYA